jgi:thermolabile hemolysin
MRIRFIVLLCLLLSLAELRAKIYIFGDSLSDTGNVFSTTGGIYPPSPYYQGRFSNGKVWVEHLAAELGSPSDAEARLNGGRNYALGGSETTTTLTSQLNLFQINLGFNQLSSVDLCILWIGGNDILNGESAIPADMIARVQSFIDALILRNARKFILVNLPDLSKLPPEIGTSNAAQTRARSIDYNTRLATLVAGINLRSGRTAVLVDVFSMFEEITASPQAYGFVTATQFAYNRDTGALVPNPNDYIFWDDRHPTATIHRLIGQIAAQVYLKRTTFIPIHAGQSSGNFVASWILPWDATTLRIEQSQSLEPATWQNPGSIQSTSARVFSISQPVSPGKSFFRLKREF